MRARRREIEKGLYMHREDGHLIEIKALGEHYVGGHTEDRVVVIAQRTGFLRRWRWIGKVAP